LVKIEKGKILTPKKMQEKTYWYECKVWKILKHSGASLNSEWGLERAMELKWCTTEKGKHLCSLNDREHAAIEEFKRKKDSGELGEAITFDNVDDLIRYLEK